MIGVEYKHLENTDSSVFSATVNVTCSIDTADGKPIFHIDYNSTSCSKVRVVERYKPMINDLGYYFSGIILEQIIVYDDTDVVCTVSDARGNYTNGTHIVWNGKNFLRCGLINDNDQRDKTTELLAYNIAILQHQNTQNRIHTGESTHTHTNQQQTENTQKTPNKQTTNKKYTN